MPELADAGGLAGVAPGAAVQLVLNPAHTQHIDVVLQVYDRLAFVS